MSKMTNEHLKMLQALPLDLKIKKTELRICGTCMIEEDEN